MQRLATDIETAALAPPGSPPMQDDHAIGGMTLAAKLAIAITVVVAAAVFAVGWLSYAILARAVPGRTMDGMEIHSRLIAAELGSSVASVHGDITGYSAFPEITGLMRAQRAGGIDPTSGIHSDVWRERVENRFLAEMAVKPAYAKMWLIGVDNGGREIIRIDRKGPDGQARLVPDAELEQKGGRDFFKKAIALQAGETYVSSIILDKDNDAAAGQHVPTLTVAMPIFAPDGTPFGIIRINFDMRPTLARARTATRPGGLVYVVNGQGDFLVHPDPSLEFGSQIGGAANWQSSFPYFVSRIGTSSNSAQILPDEAGRPTVAAIAPVLLAGREWIAVIETVPNELLMRPAVRVRNMTFVVGFVAMLCAAALAVVVARSLTRPIKQLTAAVEGVIHNDRFTIPLDAGGEMGVLAKAFARVMGEVQAKTAELEREVQQHYLTEVARDHFAERERLYSAAVELSNDAIVTQSLDGTITGWNPAAAKMFGHSAAEAVGKNISLIVPPERTNELRDALRKIGRGEQIVQQEETVRLHKDGSLVEVLLSISPIKNPAGEIVGVSTIAHDVTERRRTERALRQQTEERRRIFETSQDLIIITDAEGLMTQVSPSVETILGFLPEEMVGRNAGEFIHAADREAAKAGMRTLRRGRRTRNSDTRFIHKDGRPVMLSWMATWSEPVQRHFFIGRDMTESRLAQETLHESEQLARNIIETALDAFVQTDEVRNHSQLELASREDLWVATRRHPRQGSRQADFRGAGSSRAQCRAAAIPAIRTRSDRNAPRGHRATAQWNRIQGRTQRDRAEDAGRLRAQRVLPRSDRQDRRGRAHPAGREDAGDRPAHRRRRPRLQQYPDGDYRHDRDFGERRREGAAARGHHQDDRRGCRARCGPHPASTRVCAQTAAAAPGNRRQHADHGYHQAAATDSRRADRDRGDVRG